MAYSVAALKRAKPRYAAVINMTITMRIPAILLLAMLLSACGQRGPLYLPDENPRAPAATTSTAPADTQTTPSASEMDPLEAELEAEDDLKDGNPENEQTDEL
jgi:predicted small lipoprotein YifL